jgi:hypothetical protein
MSRSPSPANRYDDEPGDVTRPTPTRDGRDEGDRDHSCTQQQEGGDEVGVLGVQDRPLHGLVEADADDQHQQPRPSGQA